MTGSAHILWPGWQPGYRRLIGELLALALFQSGAIVAFAVSAKWLLATNLNRGEQQMAFGGLVLVVLLAALARWRERVCAEQLAVNHIHRLRLEMFSGLTRRGHAGAGARSVNTVRFASDLTAIRQWVAFTMGRLASGLLLIASALVVLSVVAPMSAVMVMTLIAIGVAIMVPLGQRLQHAVTRLRRHRGRLTHRIGQALPLLDLARRSNRFDRERQRVARASAQLGLAQVQRSHSSGAIRASADLVSRGALLCVISPGVFGWSALTLESVIAVVVLVSLLQTPIRDLSRVFEMWQSARVAERKIAPLLGPTLDELEPRVGRKRARVLHLAGGSLTSDCTLPEQSLPRGTKIAVRDESAQCVDRLFLALMGESESVPADVDGVPINTLTEAARARLIGSALAGDGLVPGSWSKNVRYRVRTASQKQMRAALAATGLGLRLESLGVAMAERVPANLRDRALIAELLWARAILAGPSLVFLQGVADELDSAGQQRFARFMANYPGTVIYTTHRDSLAACADRVWTLRDHCFADSQHKEAA